MEPRQNRPMGGYDHAPSERGNLVEQGATEVELSREGIHERHEELPSDAERIPRIGTPAPVAFPVPVALPQPPVPQSGAVTVADDTASILAADEDLIEKEWVDKAKKIISDTRDDPYAREKAVGKLQAEYIRKRYGRIIGGGNE